MTKTYDIPEEVQAVDRMTATIARLEAQKADLLAALSDLCCGHCHDMVGLPPGRDEPCGFCRDARAAIERAEAS